jgi:hypothetical protein
VQVAVEVEEGPSECGQVGLETSAWLAKWKKPFLVLGEPRYTVDGPMDGGTDGSYTDRKSDLSLDWTRVDLAPGLYPSSSGLMLPCVNDASKLKSNASRLARRRE